MLHIHKIASPTRAVLAWTRCKNCRVSGWWSRGNGRLRKSTICQCSQRLNRLGLCWTQKNQPWSPRSNSNGWGLLLTSLRGRSRFLMISWQGCSIHCNHCSMPHRYQQGNLPCHWQVDLNGISVRTGMSLHDSKLVHSIRYQRRVG